MAYESGNISEEYIDKIGKLTAELGSLSYDYHVAKKRMEQKADEVRACRKEAWDKVFKKQALQKLGIKRPRRKKHA